MQSTTIGIIGGGQLARMLIQAGINYPIKFHVFSDSKDFPSKGLCHDYTIGDLNDYQKIVDFGKKCDVITIEIENINTDALSYLQNTYHKKVYPPPELLSTIKDRYKQKTYLKNIDIPTLEFTSYTNRKEISMRITPPIVNKLCQSGYNGIGTRVIKDLEDWQDKLFDEPSIIERYCYFDRELAVIIARNPQNDIYIFPPVEMVFNKQNMLDYLTCPVQNLDDKILEKINTMARQLAEKTNLVGLLAIELFQKKDKIYVNEMAPRPHNSGHHTQNMFRYSQFDILIKCLLDLPLPSNHFTANCGSCINLLGADVKNIGPPIYQYIEELEKYGFVHIYGKNLTKPFRKMGHINIIANTKDELDEKIKNVKSLLPNNIIPNLNDSGNPSPIVGVIMGSKSDLPVMQGAIDILKEFDVPHEVRIISAHRTCEKMVEYSKSAQSRGLKVIIAGAGGAACLPSMVASCTNISTIGVPIKSSNSIDGWDSILSILQTPTGIPVATMALNGSKNASLMAVRILGMTYEMDNYRQKMVEAVEKMNQEIQQ